MKGLLLKDWLVVLKKVKRILFVVPIFAVLGGETGVIMALMICCMLVNTSFAYDDLAKWDRIQCMMPYSNRDIALSKYIFGYIGLFTGTLTVIIIQLILSVVYPPLYTLNVQILFYSLLSALMVIAVYIPISFKFGIEKARFLPIILLILASAAVSYLNASMVDDVTRLSLLPQNLLFALPLIIIVINAASILISTNILAGKKRQA